MDRAYFEQKKNEFKSQIDFAQANLNAITGAIQFCDMILQDIDKQAAEAGTIENEHNETGDIASGSSN